MAKYQVMHSCGHVVTHDLFGKIDDRNAMVERMESRLCADCFRAEQTAQAREATKGIDLPDIVGSTKQVGWAEKIRASAVMSNANKLPSFPNDEQTEGMAQKSGIPLAVCSELVRQYRDDIMAARSRLETETSAGWWIDNRHSIDSYVRMARDRAYKEFSDKIKTLSDAAKEAP